MLVNFKRLISIALLINTTLNLSIKETNNPNLKLTSHQSFSLQPNNNQNGEGCYDAYTSIENGSYRTRYRASSCQSNKGQYKNPNSIKAIHYEGSNSLKRITSDEAKIQVYLGCAFNKGLSLNPSKNQCDGVEKAFIRVGKYLENIIKFKKPVVIKAGFFPFCEVLDLCPTENSSILGQASPARFLPVKDAKGIIRLYPQALYKQLVNVTDEKVQFYDYDIIADFNSEAPFYFPTTSNPKKDQLALVDTLAHEILHGLGFISALNDYFDQGYVTFFPDVESPAKKQDVKVNQVLDRRQDEKEGKKESISVVNESKNRTKPPEGIDVASNFQFKEFIMDKYLVYKPLNSNEDTNSDSLVNVSIYLDQLNSLKVPYTYKPFTSNTKLISLASQFTTIASRANSIFFQVENALIPLETSLQPFKAGSSISHLATATYGDTKDLLMIYRREKQGVSELAKKLEKEGKRWATAPYGPHIITIMRAMGYTVNEDPDLSIAYHEAGKVSSVKAISIDFKVSVWMMIIIFISNFV